MHLTNESEIKRFEEWAAKNSETKRFTGEQADSYWNERENSDTYITEYDFNTVPEFQDLCKNILGREWDHEVKTTLSVATFKNMPEAGKPVEKKDGEALPEFIYVF